jgi:hypothetical protein
MKRAIITEDLAYGRALDRLTGADRRAPQEVKSAVPEDPGVTRIKLSVFVHRDEDAFLEGLASRAKFSGGKKISKTRIVEMMIRAFRKSSLDVNGVKSEEEFYQRAIAQLRG